jgi:ATP-dependent Clp protease ATP-binding subunit ClpC
MFRVMFLKGPAALSDRTRKAFQLAHQEAHRLNHCTVGPDHLLLGLAKEGLSHAASLLAKDGFGLSWLRQQVELRHPPGPRDVPLPAALPYSEDLAEFLDAVLTAGRYNDFVPLTPELILLALIEVEGGVVKEVFRMRRFRTWCLRRQLRALAGQSAREDR